MKKTTENLNEIFDIEGQLVTDDIQTHPKPTIKKDDNRDRDIQTDYEYARTNLYDVIETGSNALNQLVELAKASEHPRAFEVVSQLTKTLVEANKDLLDIQKKVKELRKEENNDPQNVTNALFVGSTADLQKLIKGQSE
jgi:hypothetical protein